MFKAIFTASLLGCACASAAEGVVLLHGLCRTPSSMRKLESALSDAGYVVLNVAYPSRTAPVERLSEDAIGNALQAGKLASCSRIHFVTHSLGGILVRSYFSRHADARLGRVVMLAPPNRGSEVVDTIGDWKAFRKLNGPAGTELGTGAGSAPNALGPVPFELGVIAGDRSINWINSSMIPGPDDGKVSVENTKVEGMKAHLVLHATHPYLMKNRKAILAALAFLKSGTFTAPSAAKR